jgi:NTE family protein
MGKRVALVLASGGSRGLAHIGAIEVLQERGYEISSIAGASMGALVGGIYAAGGLDAFKEWMKTIDKMKIISLMDFTLSSNGIVKGEKIIDELKKIVPDKKIEDLPIPFTAVSTDIRNRKEVIFNKGDLFKAIRASISIPSLFKPSKEGNLLMIDGGVVNPIPINLVKRVPGDLLVAVDLNAPYLHNNTKLQEKTKEEREEENSFFEKYNIHISFLNRDKKEKEESMNYYDILSESFGMMIEKNSERTIALYPPDLLIRIPKNAFSTLEFFKYEEIVEMGREKTIKALEDAGL